MASPDEITQLLQAFGDGDSQAIDHLVPKVYDALRGIAHNHLAHERPGHTLSTTALVHEAYLKLIDQREATWKNRAHFFAVASQAMRRILVDYARRRKAAKRGGDAAKVPLDDALVMADEQAEELVALDDALRELTTFDPRQATIVEYRFFGGLTIEQTAAVLDISPATVKREWTVAKAWLSHAMSQSSA
jgi:RNA polymerase sigma factor (TIGR02999 family)